MFSVQLLPNKQIFIEEMRITKKFGPLGKVLGYYPKQIAHQIKCENENV